MNIEKFLSRLLNFGDDWEVKDIFVNNELKEIDIFIEYTSPIGIFPSTKEVCKVYDYKGSRRLRHLNIFEYKTYINARIPRVINDKLEVNIVELSWADSRVSYTYSFEDSVIDTLKLSKNQTGTANYFDISFDKVHRIMQRGVNRGLSRRKLVRKQEVKEQAILKNSKYIFLKDKHKWTDKQINTFEEINLINLATSQAWHLKENFKGIYQQETKSDCLKYFEKWYKNTLDTNIKPMIKVADTILNHLKGVVNSAVNPITNSIAENLNSQIQVIKSVARGYANFKGYRNAILFF